MAEAADGAQAVDRTLADQPDLAILDISMPRLTGLQAARELTLRPTRGADPDPLMHDNEQYLFEAMKAGASGYVLKAAPDRHRVEACRSAIRGESFLYPDAVRALIRDFLARAGAGDAPPELTTPRSGGAQARCRGATNDEIADLCDISKKTVYRHRSNILDKLGMPPRVELTRYAIRRGLVQL